MKISIDLPEHVYHRVKTAAAQRKTTIKDMVIQGLEYEMSHPDRNSVVKEDLVVMKFLKGIQAENSKPVTPLTRDEIHIERPQNPSR